MPALAGVAQHLNKVSPAAEQPQMQQLFDQMCQHQPLVRVGVAEQLIGKLCRGCAQASAVMTSQENLRATCLSAASGHLKDGTR